MKRLFSLLLALVCTITFSGCGMMIDNAEDLLDEVEDLLYEVEDLLYVVEDMADGVEDMMASLERWLEEIAEMKPVPTKPWEESTEPAWIATMPLPTQSATEATEAPGGVEGTVPATEPVVAPTEAEDWHSELYIPGLDVEDVIIFFNEVCLDAEFSYGGNASLLQKWYSPIYFTLYGNCMESDYATILEMAEWLNSIEGFPGMYEANTPQQANLAIYFSSAEEMVEIMGEEYTYMDGAVTYWYNGSNQIYDATICYLESMEGPVRRSVILEEIYNGLGPVQDSWYRGDSIIYAGYSEPQELTAIDELILKLMYHPAMECGMDAEACEEVIRSLYY